MCARQMEECATLSVYFKTNLVGTLAWYPPLDALSTPQRSPETLRLACTIAPICPIPFSLLAGITRREQPPGMRPNGAGKVTAGLDRTSHRKQRGARVPSAVFDGNGDMTTPSRSLSGIRSLQLRINNLQTRDGS